LQQQQQNKARKFLSNFFHTSFRKMVLKKFTRFIIFIIAINCIKTDHFTSIEKIKKMILTLEQVTTILRSTIEIQAVKLEESIK